MSRCGRLDAAPSRRRSPHPCPRPSSSPAVRPASAASQRKRFAAEGWNVVATMRKPEPSLAEEYPDRIFVHALDVTDRASIDAAVAAAVARFGGLDAVVNNAGFTMVSIFEATPEDGHPPAVRDQRLRRDERHPGDGAAPARARRRCRSSTSAPASASSPCRCCRSTSPPSTPSRACRSRSSYELESQGIRVKLVEPGAMRKTSFGANGGAASQQAAVPEGYRALFRPRFVDDDGLSVCRHPRGGRRRRDPCRCRPTRRRGCAIRSDRTSRNMPACAGRRRKTTIAPA